MLKILVKSSLVKKQLLTRVDTKPYTRQPAAPFTTSTLQQEASRKLNMNSKQCVWHSSCMKMVILPICVQIQQHYLTKP